MRCFLGALEGAGENANDTAEITITARARCNAEGVLTNTASLKAETGELDPSDNAVEDTTTIQGLSDYCTCAQPQNPPNGEFAPDCNGSVVGESCTLNCDPGYQPQGEAVCLEGGTWTKAGCESLDL